MMRSLRMSFQRSARASPDAGAFIQDLDAVDLHRGGFAQFGGAGQGDVKRQDLIGVPGLGELLHAVDRGQGVASVPFRAVFGADGGRRKICGSVFGSMGSLY